MSNEKPTSHCACPCQQPDTGRRNILTGALAMTLAAPLASVSLPALSQAAARTARPEPGDRLAFMMGDRKGKEIKPQDLKPGTPPTMAYPLDPATGKVLESRINLLVVVRLKPEELKPTSAKNAAEGIVAFSSLCTHYGCPVTTLHPSQTQVVCNCHGSVFDAADRGTVTHGPATRRLAMLPLAIKDGTLVVAGKFDGPLGPPIS